MAKNIGDKVSRVLDSKGKSFSSVIFQQKRPPLDSEFNLIQEIQNESLSETIRKNTPSGFLVMDYISGSPEERPASIKWKNSIAMKNPVALVNGWLIHIGGGTNQINVGFNDDVWTTLTSKDEDAIAFTIGEAPTTAHRQDLVFLEVWQSVLKTTDNVKVDGFIQSSLANLTNDLIDTNLEIETSQRVQIQYRFRYSEHVDFLSYRSGLGHANVKSQGPYSSITKYTYSKHPTDEGLFISGEGKLDTVDGYIYAIPICRVHRKNKTPYSLANKNGAGFSISSGTSDRPDGLFYDEISNHDIEDLRHKVSLNGFDLDNLIEENLHALWSGDIPGELKSNGKKIDEDVIGNKIIQVDGISASGIDNVDTMNRIPDGTKRCFTEGREIQKISYTIIEANLNDGKLWFVPKGKNLNSWEYELWDENVYYSRPLSNTYRPRIFSYDPVTKVRTEISGGTWFQLGEFRPFDSISVSENVCKNRIEYVPANSADILNKNLVFMFDFYTREGGGLNQTNGGLTYNISNMVDAINLKDSSIVQCNHYNSIENLVTLSNPRKVSIFTDSAISRSIAVFEKASIPTNTMDERYKGCCVELSYYLLSTGSASITIPNVLYGRNVVTIFSMKNMTTNEYKSFNIEKSTDSFQLTGIVSSINDILKFTILCGNYLSEYVPHTRGITNFACNYLYQVTINAGDTSGVINVKDLYPTCDAAISSAGFFDGSNHKYIAYLKDKKIYLSSIEGLGTPVIKFTLDQAATDSGILEIPMLGYYNPVSSDQFCFTYSHIPYRGILRDRLPLIAQENIMPNAEERFKILKLDKNITVTNAGTGSRDQYVPEKMKGLISRLPINSHTLDYNFFGYSLYSPLSGGNSSIRRVPGWGGVLDTVDENSSFLKEGQVITLSLDLSDTSEFSRGVKISDPIFHELGYSLPVSSLRSDTGAILTNPETNAPYDLTQFNHVTQWSAIVSSLDSFNGELFLLVITTTSTVYNSSEGSEYSYLASKSYLYEDNAYGKGSETILMSGLSQSEITSKAGRKIVGSVDVIPLIGRPLIKV